jgi:hypothetical protein
VMDELNSPAPDRSRAGAFLHVWFAKNMYRQG